MVLRRSLYSRRTRVDSIATATTTTTTLLLVLLAVSSFLGHPVASQDNTPPLTSPADSVASPGASPAGTADVPASAPPPAKPAAASGGTSWGGCVSPEKGFELVTIDARTTICLVLSSGGDWSSETEYMRLNFAPIADTYSRFHVPRSFRQLVGTPREELTGFFPGNITVHSESQTALSFQKLYYDAEKKRIYPYLTAIISVDKGSITGITWDNACVFCSASECEDNTYGYDGQLATKEEALQPVGGCSLSVEECEASTKAECDLMLYVVWAGTDSNGRDFTSSANRFSAFPKQSWSDRLSLNLGMPDWMDNINPFGGDSNGE